MRFWIKVRVGDFPEFFTLKFQTSSLTPVLYTPFVSESQNIDRTQTKSDNLYLSSFVLSLEK